MLFWLVDSALAAGKGRPSVEITEATIESLNFQSLHEATKTLLDQNFMIGGVKGKSKKWANFFEMPVPIFFLMCGSIRFKNN